MEAMLNVSRAWRLHALLPLVAALGLYFGSSQLAKADFVGDYALSNFTLTNTNDGEFPSYTNGTETSMLNTDGTEILVLTGGNSGSGIGGVTDFFITAAASGTVDFDWSYSSTDLSSHGVAPYGCGAGFAQSCDNAGYLLGGTATSNYVELASDTNQGSGFVSFTVTAGETFGFSVETADNQGGAGILTVSEFNAPSPDPVPEPSTVASVVGLTAVLLAARRKMGKVDGHKENAA